MLLPPVTKVISYYMAENTNGTDKRGINSQTKISLSKLLYPTRIEFFYAKLRFA